MPPPLPLPAPFRVGPWTVRPASHELVRDDGPVLRVEPKVMALLVALAEQAGEPVARETLLDRVWPGVVVTEDALSRAVSKLRRALGDDDPDAPCYVETIPKAGYRLVAPVRVDAEPEPQPAVSVRVPDAQVRRPLGLGGLVVFTLAVALGVYVWQRPDAVPTVRTLTHLPGVETHPAFSPDGARVAFAAERRAGADGADVWVTGLDGAAPLLLTTGPADDLHPAWSPDGTHLAFLRCRGLACRVFSVPLLGGGAQRRLDATVGPWGFSWSPEGRHVAAAARPSGGGPYRVLLLDAETGATRPLTAPPPGETGDLFPAFSPDGRLVAFVRHGVAGEDVWTVPVGGGTSRRVTTAGVPVAGFAWGLDSRTLIVSATYGGHPALWRVPLGGGVPERLPATIPGARRLALAAGRLVVEARQAEVNLYTARLDAVPLDSGAVTLVPAVVSTGASTQPALRPDGRRLAFVSDRSGTPELWTAALDGTDAVRLTSLGGGLVGAPRWSPDGRWLVFEAQPGGRAAVYRVAAEGGRAVPLTHGAGYAFGPRFSRDGRAVYFGSDVGGRSRVWRVPLGGGTPVPVADGAVGEESADGRALLVTHADAPGLWRVPFDGGPARAVDTRLDRTDWGNWVVTARGVFLVERTGASAQVVRLDPDTGRRTVVLAGIAGVPSRAPALSATPDGRRLVLARADRIESALVLAEPVE